MASIPQVSFGQYPQRPMPTQAQVPQYGPGLRNLAGTFQNLNENLTENEKLKMAYQELLQKKRDAILARRQAEKKAAFEQRKHDEGMEFKRQKWKSEDARKTEEHQINKSKIEADRKAREAAQNEYFQKLEKLPESEQRNVETKASLWRDAQIRHGMDPERPVQKRTPSVVINNQQKAQQAERMIPALEAELQASKDRLAQILGNPHLKTVTWKNMFDEIEKSQFPQEPEQRKYINQQIKNMQDLRHQLAELYAQSGQDFPTEKIYSQPEADPRDPAGLGIYE